MPTYLTLLEVIGVALVSFAIPAIPAYLRYRRSVQRLRQTLRWGIAECDRMLDELDQRRGAGDAR